MSLSRLVRHFEEYFAEYIKTSGEECLARISDIGRELVHSGIPPEDIGEIFEKSLKAFAEKDPTAGISAETAEKLSVPLTELLMAYGLAFREQLDRQRDYEESRLASKIMENSVDAIWMTDEKGNIQTVNPSFSRITGYDFSEINGKNIMSLHIFAVDEVVTQKIWEIVRKDGVWRGELASRRKNGEIFPALLSISVIRAETDHSFSQNDKGEILNYVGALNDISEKHRQESIKLELDRAREIYNLVVQPQLPEVKGIEFNVKCIPAENIGGDIMEIVKVDEKRLIIFLADITGHGVSAAMTANTLKMLFREVSESTVEPARIFKYINNVMYKNVLPDDMIAAFCGLVDLEAMTITYCLNGLPQPFIYRSSDVIRLTPTGFPLGVFDVFEGKSVTMPVRNGDLFILFSDGVTEIRSETGEVFGNAGLERCLSGSSFDVHAIIDHLLKSASVFQHRDTFTDDIIILAASFYDDKIVTSEVSRSNTYSFPTKSMCKGKTKFLFIDEVVSFFQKFVSEKTRIPKEELGWLKIALFELVFNAIEHGNLQLTEYKNNSEFYDSEGYWQIFNERMVSEEYGDKEVAVECFVDQGEVRITIQDEGAGFDADSATKPLTDESLSKPSGRGIALARMNVDKLIYNSKGNMVTLIKKL